MGADPNDGKQNHPCQTDRLAAAQSRVQPRSRLLVVRASSCSARRAARWRRRRPWRSATFLEAADERLVLQLGRDLERLVEGEAGRPEPARPRSRIARSMSSRVSGSSVMVVRRRINVSIALM